MNDTIFLKEFDLFAFNKANPKLCINSDDELYKAFLLFLSNDNLINQAIIENDSGRSPVAFFISCSNQRINAIIKSFNNDKKQIKQFRKKIVEIWSFLFLQINKNIYKNKKMIKSNLESIIPHVPVYFKNEDKKLRVFVEGTLFATRAVACIKSYSSTIDDILCYCDPIIESDSIYSPLVSYYISHCFQDDETSLDKKVARFNGGNSDICKKCDSSVFLLKKDISITKSTGDDNSKTANLFDLDNIFSQLKTIIKSYSEQVIINTNHNKVIAYLEMNYSKIKDSIETAEKDYVIKIANRIHDDFKKARQNITNYYGKLETTNCDFSLFSELGKIVSKIRDLVDIFEILKEDNYRVLLYLNKIGTINIVLMENISFRTEWDNDEYDDNADNKLAAEAFKSSIKIENSNHRLAKLFNIINLNKIIRPTICRKSIFGQPYDFFDYNINKSEDPVSKQIFVNNNTIKSIYLRLTYNEKDIMVGDESAMIYFDYLSLLVGHSHSYDKYTLWEYTNHNKPIVNELKDKIKDFASSRTSHIYYDDSLFVYSIMDQSHRFKSFNALINTNPNYKYLQSHKHILYSLWEFSLLCDALVFGACSILIHSLLISQVCDDSKFVFKPRVLSSQHLLSKIYSEINLKFNHLVFTPKGRNFKLMNSIFDNLGLIDVEQKTKNTFDANWQFANLNNGRFYQRIGLYFTIASFCISTIAFAWAGAIFLDCNIQKSEGYNWTNLFEDLFKTAKLHFVLIIAAIPLIFLLVLSVFEYICTKRTMTNIVGYFVKQRIKK